MIWLERLSLTSLWWAVGFAVVAVALIALAVVLRRRGRRARVWVPTVVGALLVGLVAVGAGMNANQGWYLTVGDLTVGPGQSAPEIDMGDPLPSDTSRGVHLNAEIPGPISGVGSQPADIWLPPQYFSAPKRAFPVVYLFHGTPGTSNDWFDLAEGTQIALREASVRQPVILVAPTAAPEEVDSECVNGSAGNWETYSTKDVINYVDANFRVLTGPAHTATAGLSMGGYCAQMLALRHPDLYSVAGNFSGTTNADFEGGLAALFGPVSDLQREIKEHSSAWLIKNRPAARGVSVWLEVGSNDSATLIADQQRYCALAKSLSTDTVCYTVPGGHTSAVWAASFDRWLEWAAPRLK